MYRIIIRFVCLGFIAFYLLFQTGCSSSFPNIELKSDYDFSSKESITIYIVPSGRKTLDETYAKVLQLDLQSRGYKIINANQLLLTHSDSVIGMNHRQIADLLLARNYLSSSDVIAVVRPIWDSIYFATDLSEKFTLHGRSAMYQGYNLLSLNSEVTFFDRSIREPLKSYAASDTTRLYFEEDLDYRAYVEFPWMLVAKQLTQNLENIPICAVINSSPVTNQLGVSFWVDKSYREAFPKTWKDRIKLRVLFANDIFRSQFGLELIISEFKEWNSHFRTSLQNTLNDLKDEIVLNSNLFRIGFTLDKELRATWNMKSKLGIAVLLGSDAVISAQPSFPEVAQFWNPLEESITLVHEVGHMLGAIHVLDRQSIMYPSSGSLSVEFDEVNHKIIQSTNNNFFDDEKYRVQNYIKELIKIRESAHKNSIPVLPHMVNTLNDLYRFNSLTVQDKNRLYSRLSSIISDSIHTLATIGYIEFKIYRRFEKAKDLFNKVIELDPDFAEVHWYLYLLYEKMGDNIRADRHKKIAKPYRNLWVLDDY